MATRYKGHMKMRNTPMEAITDFCNDKKINYGIFQTMETLGWIRPLRDYGSREYYISILYPSRMERYLKDFSK